MMHEQRHPARHLALHAAACPRSTDGSNRISPLRGAIVQGCFNFRLSEIHAQTSCVIPEQLEDGARHRQCIVVLALAQRLLPRMPPAEAWRSMIRKAK